MTAQAFVWPAAVALGVVVSLAALASYRSRRLERLLARRPPDVVFNLVEPGNLKRVMLGETIGTLVRGGAA